MVTGLKFKCSGSKSNGLTFRPHPCSDSKHSNPMEVVPTISITFPSPTPILLASIFMQLKDRTTEVGWGELGIGVPGSRRSKISLTYLFRVSANLNGIGNEASCFLFSHGADVFQTDRQLAPHRDGEQIISKKRHSLSRPRVFMWCPFRGRKSHLSLLISKPGRDPVRHHLV